MGQRLVRVGGSASCFFCKGLTATSFHSLGTFPADKEEFIMLLMIGLTVSIRTCKIREGQGSKGDPDLTARIA